MKASRDKGVREEVWRDVVTFGEYAAARYEVSSRGRVRTKEDAPMLKRVLGRIHVGSIDTKGYKQVVLTIADKKARTVKIHRLVVDSFLSGKKRGEQVNHIDGNKLNNRVDNLEIVTNRENSWHAERVLRRNRNVVVCGEAMSLAEAHEKFGNPNVPYKAVYRRWRRYGWSAFEAMSRPLLGTGMARGQKSAKS